MINPNIKKMIDSCENIEQLSGIASEIKENDQQMSWTKLYCVAHASRLRYGGMSEIARILGITPSYASRGVKALNEYGEIAENYPRITPSYLLALHENHVPQKKAEELLARADDQANLMPISVFKREIKKEMGIEEAPKHICDKCGYRHSDRRHYHND